MELAGDDLHGRFATDDMDLPPGKTAWYIDGGVLDNKPFTCALPMIYQRHADRPVDRMLFFVEPDPEADDKVTPAEMRAAEPNFLETALALALLAAQLREHPRRDPGRSTATTARSISSMRSSARRKAWIAPSRHRRSGASTSARACTA